MRNSISKYFYSIAGADNSISILNSLEADLEQLKPSRHPYGFLIYRLNDARNHQVRLHVWLNLPRKRQVPDWPIHDHNAKLNSFVLDGRLINQCFRFNENTDGLNQIYEVSYCSGSSLISKTELIGDVSLTRTDSLKQQSQYSVERHQLHSTDVAPSDRAMTLVLLSKDSEGSARVIGNRDGSPEYQFSRESVSTCEVSKANEYIRLILF